MPRPPAAGGRRGPEAVLRRDFDTLGAIRRHELRVKGSRFIATAAPVASAGEAGQRIEALRLGHADATHLCWAYRIAAEQRDIERFHDAGEPSGTAGAPILQALRAAGLLNVVAVVARHFGGTKLGKGGLARAYRDAVRGALDAAPRARHVRRASLKLAGPVDQDGEVRHLVARLGGRVARAGYPDGAGAVLEIEVPAARVDELARAVRDLTRGAWRVARDGRQD